MRLTDFNLMDIDRRVIVRGADGVTYEGTLVLDPFFVGRLAFLEDGEDMPNVFDIWPDDDLEFM